MRYVLLFAGGFFFLFWDGYYHKWSTTNAILREIDRLLGYIF